MRLPKLRLIDYDYRPSSYLETQDDLEFLLKKNVRSNTVRKFIEHAVKNGLSTNDLQELIEEESIAEMEEFAKYLGSIHPSHMGGCYLEPLKPFEVEIGRLDLASVTGDAISIRARQTFDGWVYRIIDEYEDSDEPNYSLNQATSKLPLTLEEFVNLIDQAIGPWEEGSMTLPYGYTLMNLEGGAFNNAKSVKVFTRFQSDFYTGAFDHYQRELEAFIKNYNLN